MHIHLSSPREGGGSSIPEAAMVEPIERGVLDTRRSLSSGSPNERPGGGYDNPLCDERIASFAMTRRLNDDYAAFKIRTIRNKSLLQVSGDCASDVLL